MIMRATSIQKNLNEKSTYLIGQVLSLSYDIVKTYGGELKGRQKKYKDQYLLFKYELAK
jgi:hypothetical protein